MLDMFKVNNTDNKATSTLFCDVVLMPLLLTLNIFIVNFEQISHTALVFLLLTLNK